MKRTILLLIPLLSLACSQVNDPAGANEDTYVKLHIHFQQGFARQQVAAALDSEEFFRTIFSPFVSLSGPQATLTTLVKRGGHRITISWNNLGQLNEHSAYFEIGTAEQYYLGLQVSDTTLIARLQEEPFGYV